MSRGRGVRPALFAVALAGCLSPSGGHHTAAWISDTSSYGSPAAPAVPARPASSPTAIAELHGATATKIIAAARADRGAYAKLAHLTDRIGHRLAGSASLDRAIAWAAGALAADGHVVRTEKVMVPHWVRGTEEAALITPVARPLRLLGLGGSVPTPKGGLTAPVIVVRDFAELEARAAQVKGAIVLYDVALSAWTDDKPSNYGAVAAYRTQGASRAARLGAVGVLIRSITAHSLRTPHTGAISYDAAQPKIPAAAISVEDAQLIARLAADGPVSVKLRLDSRVLPDAPSANVIGELRGRERPDEIVVIGAHLDSWDVGQGAHDDGAGCVAVMQAITLLRELGLQPRRTIRVVLFTNEENGLRGARAYAKDHAAELPNHVLALESDVGGFRPRAFLVAAPPEVSARVIARLAEIAGLLAPLGASTVMAGGAGADVGPLVPGGVPALNLITDARTYFDYHHSEADTLDKVDPAHLAEQIAAIAVLAYVVAELPDRIDQR